MNNKSYLWLFLAAGTLAASTVAQAQGYDYEPINYPGANATALMGINHRGDAVGFASIEPDNFPFIYDTRHGTLETVAPVAGYDSTILLGISGTGDIVGSVFDDSTLLESGLILDQNGAATVFDHPDAADLTQARAVNNRGLVTGIRSTSDPSQFIASFIYDPATNTFTDIVPSIVTIAQGINTRGDVVGSAVYFTEDDPCNSGAPGTARHGWLRTAEGNITYFSVNGLRTSARGITDSGTIVGFVTEPFTGETKGFVTKLDGTQCQAITIADEDLIQFPGALISYAQGITSSGVIVGSYVTDIFNNIGGGFIATKK